MSDKSLDESIGFWLGITYRKMAQLFQQRIKDDDITPEQWAVLYRVWEQNGAIQKTIGERSGKDKPTTTRILDLLEAKGHVVKRTGADDRRSFAVFITDSGKELVERIRPIEAQVVRDATEGFADNEYALLLRLLRRISGNVDELSDKEAECASA